LEQHASFARGVGLAIQHLGNEASLPSLAQINETELCSTSGGRARSSRVVWTLERRCLAARGTAPLHQNGALGRS
jgi:hypothetical protein